MQCIKLVSNIIKNHFKTIIRKTKFWFFETTNLKSKTFFSISNPEIDFYYNIILKLEKPSPLDNKGGNCTYEEPGPMTNRYAEQMTVRTTNGTIAARVRTRNLAADNPSRPRPSDERLAHRLNRCPLRARSLRACDRSAVLCTFLVTEWNTRHAVLRFSGCRQELGGECTYMYARL